MISLFEDLLRSKFTQRLIGVAEISIAALKSGAESSLAESREYAKSRFLNDDEFIDFLTRLDALTQRVQDLDRRIDALGQ